VEPLGGDEAAEAAERHGQLCFGGIAVDAVQASDQYYRLALDSCFYVAGMGASCRAESIGAAEYMARPRRAMCCCGLLPHRELSVAGVDRPLVPAQHEPHGMDITPCADYQHCMHGDRHALLVLARTWPPPGQLNDAFCDLSLPRSPGRPCTDSRCTPGVSCSHAVCQPSSHAAAVSCSGRDPARVPWRHSPVRSGQARPAGRRPAARKRRRPLGEAAPAGSQRA
jgi:hypothetical protein